jgi:hypothetical protein
MMFRLHICTDVPQQQEISVPALANSRIMWWAAWKGCKSNMRPAGRRFQTPGQCASELGNEWVGNPQVTLVSMITMDAMVAWGIASLPCNHEWESSVMTPSSSQTPHPHKGHWPQATLISLAPFAKVKFWRTLQNCYSVRAFPNFLAQWTIFEKFLFPLSFVWAEVGETVIEANLYVRRPLEVKGKGTRGVADKEAYTVHVLTLFPSGSPLVFAFSVPVSVMYLDYIVYALFSFYPQANDVSETHALVPGTAHWAHTNQN